MGSSRSRVNGSAYQTLFSSTFGKEGASKLDQRVVLFPLPEALEAERRAVQSHFPQSNVFFSVHHSFIVICCSIIYSLQNKIHKEIFNKLDISDSSSVIINAYDESMNKDQQLRRNRTRK